MEDMDPKDRAYNFIPKLHDCLRRVSGKRKIILILFCCVFVLLYFFPKLHDCLRGVSVGGVVYFESKFILMR